MTLMSTLVIVATAFSASGPNMASRDPESFSHHWTVTTITRLPNQATCLAIKAAAERMARIDAAHMAVGGELNAQCIPDAPDSVQLPSRAVEPGKKPIHGRPAR